jgi:putative lipoprotein (rSAM/lipoprotein system)
MHIYKKRQIEMKKIQTRFLLNSNKIIGIILSVLGFSGACSLSSCEYGAQVVAYGTPHATFIVKGDVKSENDSSAIPNIRVVMNHDTTYTNESGSYQVETIDFPKDQVFFVEFDDMDGSIFGEYQALDTIVEFKDPQFSGSSGSWDEGTTEKEVNVKLKVKE